MRSEIQRKLFEQAARLRIVLSGATVSAAVFAVCEVIQQNYFQSLNYHPLHYLYITRGIALAFFLVAWAACIVVAHCRATITWLRRLDMKYGN